MALFLALVDHAGPDPQEPLRSLIGQHAAELWTLRLMPLSVAAKLASGEDPMLVASLVKALGNSQEQDLPRLVQASVDCVLTADRQNAWLGTRWSVGVETGGGLPHKKKTCKTTV